jgi:hypothetical protein
MNTNAPVIVFGEGSASVFLLQELLKRNENIVWISGSGARLLPVMPSVKSEAAVAALLEAQAQLQADTLNPSLEQGVCHRVFRNKGFKLPTWKKSSQLEVQKEAFKTNVWTPEQAFLGLQEFRLKGLHPTLLEEQMRASFENHPQITKVQSAPVLEFEVYEHGGKIQLANGLITEFKAFYFCDEMGELKAIPKLMTVFKHQMSSIKMGDRMSALQVVFHHSVPLKQMIDTGLVIPMNRDSGETFDRDVLGYFVEPTRSVWTVFLQSSECEENHEIMKKLRKLKQSLNRAFDSPEFLPEGKKEFMATVEKEQVRFEENYLITAGSIKESSSNPDFILLNDGFGFSASLERLAKHFGYSDLDLDLFTALETEPVSIEASEIDGIEMPAHLTEMSSELHMSQDTI